MNIHQAMLSLSCMTLVYVWLFAALAFLFIELATPGLFFFVAFAAGSAVAAATATIGYSFDVQCLVALSSSVVAFVFVRYYFARRIKGASKLRTNTCALIGRQGVILQSITPMGAGLVKIGGERWSAKAAHDQKVPEGSIIKVVAVVGNHVLVELK